MNKIFRMHGRQLVQGNSALDRRWIITANTLTGAPQSYCITEIKLDLKHIGVSLSKQKGEVGMIGGKLTPLLLYQKMMNKSPCIFHANREVGQLASTRLFFISND